MKTYKINQKQYFDKDDVEIEVTKEVETIVQTKVEILTVRQIKEKIEKVKEEKELVVARYNKEIDELKAVLKDLKVDEVKISKQEIPDFMKEKTENKEIGLGENSPEIKKMENRAKQ